MTAEIARSATEQALRWIAESPTVFELLRRMLHAYDQATVAARAAQTERERLLQQYDALREQVRQLHAQVVRLEKERTDAAQWFVAMMLEAAAQLPLPPT
jgi:hypothetical protein